jgi:glycine hydroxymethyltransferase
MQPSFREYSANVIRNAQLLAKFLVDKGRHVLTGTTKNHIVLLDVTTCNIDGRDVDI